MKLSHTILSLVLLTTTLPAAASDTRLPCDAVEIYDANTGQWRKGPDQTSAASLAPYTQLQDGRILTAGGYDTYVQSGKVFYYSVNRTRIFDPKSLTWSEAAPMLQARVGHSLRTLSDGRVLAVSGYWREFDQTQHPYLNHAEVYDPKSNTWTRVADPIVGRDTASSATASNGGFATWRGWSNLGTSYEQSGEYYDSLRDRWQPIDPADVLIDYPVGLPDGSIWFSGSFQLPTPDAPQPDRPVAETRSWNPQTGWKKTAPLQIARFDHEVESFADGTVLITGGRTRTWQYANESIELADAELYDPQTDRTTLVAPMHHRRALPSTVRLSDTEIFVYGGTEQNTYVGAPMLHRSGEIYSKTTGQWTDVPAPSSACDFVYPFALPGRQVVLMGGSAR